MSGVPNSTPMSLGVDLMEGSGMMSTIVNGKVLDWKFKKRKVDTVFYIGDIFVGQIFKLSNTYSVVGKTPNELSPIDGLATRWQAAQLLLKMEGYTE